MQNMSIQDFIAEVKSYLWMYKPEGVALSTAVYNHTLWTLGKINRKRRHHSLEHEVVHEPEYKNPKETVDILLKCPSLSEKEIKAIRLRLALKSPSDIIRIMKITRSRLSQLERSAKAKMRKYAESLGDRI
jgi:DNA-directed RNA polymerase specialized sigma subunit